MWRQLEKEINQLKQIVELTANGTSDSDVDDQTLNSDFFNALDYINKNVFNPGGFMTVIELESLRMLYASDNCIQLFDDGKTAFQTSSDLPLSLLLSGSMPLFKHTFDQLSKMSQHVPAPRRKSVKRQLVGLPIKAVNGTRWVSFATILPLKAQSDGTPSVILMINRNIAHLYTADFIWLRQSYGPMSYYNRYFHSGLDEVVGHDILSRRELQIVELLAQGLNSHEIAVKLNISVNTVSNHRKNMTYRIGVSDTTALLQIAQWCELI
jgi:DNA-binding CsgD family transcriptional regulator